MRQTHEPITHWKKPAHYYRQKNPQIYGFKQGSGGTWRFVLESDQNLAEREAAITAIEIEDRTRQEGRDIAWMATSSGPIIRMELANEETGKEQGLVKEIRVGGGLSFVEVKVCPVHAMCLVARVELT